jgi:hypothetical protein
VRAKISEMFNHKQFPVVFGALVVILIGALAHSRRTTAVDPRVTWEQNRRSPEKQPPFVPAAARLVAVMNGEVSHMADRVAEATTLAFSAGAYLGNEGLNGRRPRDVQALLSGIAQSRLLPPTFEFSQSAGTLVSPWGSVSVRYRPKPLGIEVISIASKPEYGPALIVRVPDDSSDKEVARLFVADRLQGVAVPEPFTSAPEVIARGWRPERLP